VSPLGLGCYWPFPLVGLEASYKCRMSGFSDSHRRRVSRDLFLCYTRLVLCEWRDMKT